MSESKCGCPVCDGYNIETTDSVIIQHLDNLLNARNSDDIQDAIYTFFNIAYMMGFKAALIERVENDIKTLNYMNNNI